MKPFKVKTYSKFFAASFHEKMLSGSSFTPDVTGTFFLGMELIQNRGIVIFHELSPVQYYQYIAG